MLLPLSLDCAPRIQGPRVSFTPSGQMVSPPASLASSLSANISPRLNSNCWPYHFLLFKNPSFANSSERLSQPPLTSPFQYQSSQRQPRLAGPFQFNSSMHSRKSTRAPPKTADVAKPATRREASRKRCRQSIDGDDVGQENGETVNTDPSTPKRQRLYPPCIPLGLQETDFEALQKAAAAIPLPTTPPNQLSAASQDGKDRHWNTADGSALASAVRHKLRINQSQWDDFAHHSGKEEVGLRRGKGSQTRGSVGVFEWGPPLHDDLGDVTGALA